MLRVLLVDDQQVELDGLSELLPWGNWAWNWSAACGMPARRWR